MSHSALKPRISNSLARHCHFGSSVDMELHKSFPTEFDARECVEYARKRDSCLTKIHKLIKKTFLFNCYTKYIQIHADGVRQMPVFFRILLKVGNISILEPSI